MARLINNIFVPFFQVMPTFNISSLSLVSPVSSSSSNYTPNKARRQFIIDIIDEAYRRPQEQGT
jgi:hypothetical protein